MSKEFSFSVMPTVSISRSRFARKSQHKTSFNLGDLIPIFCDEVLPGDTRSIDMASLVRMSTPIAPLMDNIYLDIFCFFTPNRILWTHWKEFMGENSVSAGIPTTTYVVPKVAFGATRPFQSGSYGDYFGLPVGVNGVAFQNRISALPFRALALIYNRWFRDENLIAPLAVQTGDQDEAIVGDLINGNNFVNMANQVLKVAKLPDYFTKSLPYAQKAAPVTIGIGSTAPIIGASTMHSLGTHRFKLNDGSQASGILELQNDFVNYNSQGATGTTYPLTHTNLVADLSNATAVTINQLRYAFQLQKLLEKDCMGSRYWEILSNHFGINAPDSSLQDPEYLGGTRININIDQVLSTAGYQAGVSTEVGAPGANSVTAHKGSLFTKSFVEHGYIIIVACARQEATYGQGIERMWTRQGRYDYYWPVFANLGAQEVKNKEIYAQGSSSDEGTFGYQEAWAEYRYARSKCTSKMRPYVSGGLGFWTLAERFSSLPTLGQTFIEQGRDNIKDALVTGVTGPDFIADFFFKDIAVRPMPVYSIPGLVDHH